MRNAEIYRKTAETDIYAYINLDGTGDFDIKTGVGFLDHMLILLSRHSRIDMTIKCAGDTYVDDHHSVEDTAICIGAVIREALGEKRGICRYGSATIPMDEALVTCAIDISGRGGLYMNIDYPTEKIGSFDTQLVYEFMAALSRESGMTIHFQMLAGTNSHHIAECQFKSLARALKAAVAIDPDIFGEIPSTKGVL